MESKKALPLQSFSERDTAKLRTLKRIATIEVVQETSLSVLNEGRYGNKSSLSIFHPRKNNDTKDPAFTRQSSPLGITPAREVRDTFSAKATT
ncbi:hypothetical protein, partial [Duncaniella muricolitica]|uniref:hypothetical protein n=1 Tax=Duncaniella muricolitica TaxID=2880704 RepID=UPI00244E148B